MNKYLDLSPEVAAAKAAGKPVVALESTIISHGMPYPQNVETALRVEQTIRENGAVPATIAVIGGRLKAGLTPEEIEYLGKKGRGVAKASRRDLPVLVARGADGATTVTTTMIIAALAGIKVFATGGVGGVHRGAETTMDISADLEELAKTPVMVICAGAKSILDLGLTLEYLHVRTLNDIGEVGLQLHQLTRTIDDIHTVVIIKEQRAVVEVTHTRYQCPFTGRVFSTIDIGVAHSTTLVGSEKYIEATIVVFQRSCPLTTTIDGTFLQVVLR